MKVKNKNKELIPKNYENYITFNQEKHVYTYFYIE